MTENKNLETQIADDLRAVLKEAKRMGCKEVTRFSNIPLQNVEIAIKALTEIQTYWAIGTVEEFKTLKEKNEPEKPLGYKYSWDCPRCGTFHSINGKYCSECGQAVEFE